MVGSAPRRLFDFGASPPDDDIDNQAVASGGSCQRAGPARELTHVVLPTRGRVSGHCSGLKACIRGVPQWVLGVLLVGFSRSSGGFQ